MIKQLNLLNGIASSEENDSSNINVFGEKLLEIFKKSKISDSNDLTQDALDKLSDYISKHKETFIKQIMLDTGYTKNDSHDLVLGSIEFISYFLQHIMDIEQSNTISKFSYVDKVSRTLLLRAVPYGVVATMTPQNAPLILELTVILNVIKAGNTIILRPSSQCSGTVSLLIEALLSSFPQSILKKISIVTCQVPEFLSLSYNHADLIHYIGSSNHGRKILETALVSNKTALVDGEGSSLVVVDNTASIKDVVQACRDGIVRCNGELCSTVRTIIVNEDIYPEFATALTNELIKINVGDPLKVNVDMGPVFHESQADNLRAVAKKYQVLVGEDELKKVGTKYINPILCQLKKEDKNFLNEEFYGPLAGIVSYKGDEWKDWVKFDRFQLNDTVFSKDSSFIENFIQTSKAPRVVVNSDPSVESVFEPWGAFLPCGQNNVSCWIDKYRKVIQIDNANNN